VVGVVLALGVGVAAATVTTTVLTDTNAVRLKIVRTDFVPSTEQPIFDSGWHTHPGPVIFQVQRGKVRIFQGSCEPKVLQPGDTYVEVPEVPVKAKAKIAASWTTTLIRDDAKPDKTDVTTSPCP